MAFNLEFLDFAGYCGKSSGEKNFDNRKTIY